MRLSHGFAGFLELFVEGKGPEFQTAAGEVYLWPVML